MMDCQERYKSEVLSQAKVVYIWSSEDIVSMLSLALFYILTVICSARRTHASPLYPDSNLEPQAGRKKLLCFFVDLHFLA